MYFLPSGPCHSQHLPNRSVPQLGSSLTIKKLKPKTPYLFSLVNLTKSTLECSHSILPAQLWQTTTLTGIFVCLTYNKITTIR